MRQNAELLYSIGEAESSYLRGLKLGLEWMGICKSTLAFPFASADPLRHEEPRKSLQEYL